MMAYRVTARFRRSCVVKGRSSMLPSPVFSVIMKAFDGPLIPGPGDDLRCLGGGHRERREQDPCNGFL